MLAWGIVVLLCCVILGQTLLFRRERRRLTQALAETQSAPPPEVPPAEAPAPVRKLYLPELSEEDDCLVYFNENTGIYHADRACAPYQAVPVSLAEIQEHARPCKKCAEGRFPTPLPQELPSEAEEDQLSLFEL